MCPACMAAAVILAAKVTSAGGLTAYAASKLRTRSEADRSTLPHKTPENHEPTPDRVG
jgi:hypothetical protein